MALPGKAQGWPRSRRCTRKKCRNRMSRPSGSPVSKAALLSEGAVVGDLAERHPEPVPGLPGEQGRGRNDGQTLVG